MALTQTCLSPHRSCFKSHASPCAIRHPCRLAVRVTATTEPALSSLRASLGKTAASVLLGSTLLLGQPALADLNKYEAAAGGEFGNGSALQFGEADLVGRDFSAQDLRRSNFTAADCRNCNFKNSNLQGAYFIKTVLFKTNFENANLSDILMDRAVLNEANLVQADLQRTVLTRSDLTGAKITGADFTNALVDKTQQMALCKYADGVNEKTGVDTRKSLGCGSRRRFRESQPSSSEGPQVEQDAKDAFVKSMPVYRK